MNKKDVSQLKRAFGKEEDCPIVRVASCYVDVTSGEIMYQKSELLQETDEEEAEQYRAFLKKAITGKPGSTILEISPEENALEALKRTRLEDEEEIESVCEKIRDSYQSDENYGVFMAYGAYDVPAESEGADSDETYEFVLLMIQPCALSKAGIVYDAAGNRYKDRKKDRPLGAPLHSFLSPSFSDGHADFDRAAYFSKSAKIQEQASETLHALFGTGLPMTEQEQKDAFAEMMTACFGQSVPYEAARGTYEKFSEIRAEAESGTREAKLTVGELKDIIGNDADADGSEALEEAAEQFAGKRFVLDNIAPKSVGIKTDAAVVKVDLNEMPEIDVIEYKGRRCLAVPLSSAIVENLNIN